MRQLRISAKNIKIRVNNYLYRNKNNSTNNLKKKLN